MTIPQRKLDWRRHPPPPCWRRAREAAVAFYDTCSRSPGKSEIDTGRTTTWPIQRAELVFRSLRAPGRDAHAGDVHGAFDVLQRRRQAREVFRVEWGHVRCLCDRHAAARAGCGFGCPDLRHRPGRALSARCAIASVTSARAAATLPRGRGEPSGQGGGRRGRAASALCGVLQPREAERQHNHRAQVLTELEMELATVRECSGAPRRHWLGRTGPTPLRSRHCRIAADRDPAISVRCPFRYPGTMSAPSSPHPRAPTTVRRHAEHPPPSDCVEPSSSKMHPDNLLVGSISRRHRRSIPVPCSPRVSDRPYGAIPCSP